MAHFSEPYLGHKKGRDPLVKAPALFIRLLMKGCSLSPLVYL